MMAGMRVLIAPDAFTGTLSAVEAARAIAVGWARRAPDDDLVEAPMSDGGPGFVDVLHAALGGDLLATTVTGPTGAPVPATVLAVGSTAYVEAAQVVGAALLAGADPETLSSAGVGELLVAAVETGAETVVVGLGGCGVFDAGAGVLATLGAEPRDLLAAGIAGLGSVTDYRPARPLGARIVIATDVDIPLAGLFGAVKTSGVQYGLTEEQLPGVDGVLEAFAAQADRRVALAKGAGAGAGLGYALMLLGGERTPGVALVADEVGLHEQARAADLVVTGEGSFDFSSRSGKVPYGVAEVAAAALRPCIALAGRVQVGSREMRALGIESAYSTVELVGEQRALADPAGALADLAERVARTWSRPRPT